MTDSEHAPIRKWAGVYWDGRVSIGNIISILTFVGAILIWFLSARDNIQNIAATQVMNTFRIERLESAQAQARADFGAMIADQQRVIGNQLEAITRRLELIDNKLDSKADKPGR